MFAFLIIVQMSGGAPAQSQAPLKDRLSGDQTFSFKRTATRVRIVLTK